jgi:hypothetical protein
MIEPRRRRSGRGSATGRLSTWRPGWREVIVFIALAVLAHLLGWGGPLGEEFPR